MRVTCHECGRVLETSMRDLGERVAMEIKPKGLRTRYYCIRCTEEIRKSWEKENRKQISKH